MLLKSARLLVYTPSNEHFGIVPLEAMLAGVPVLAANTGGPLETVLDGKTGWLCAPDQTDRWTEVMSNVLHKMSNKEIKNFGNAGTERVKREFSNVKMAERLDGIVDAMAGKRRRSTQEIISFFLTILAVNLDYAYYIALRHSGPVRTVGLGKGKKLHSPPGGLTIGCVICWLGYFWLSIFEKRKARQEALARERNR